MRNRGLSRDNHTTRAQTPRTARADSNVCICVCMCVLCVIGKARHILVTASRDAAARTESVYNYAEIVVRRAPIAHRAEAPKIDHVPRRGPGPPSLALRPSPPFTLSLSLFFFATARSSLSLSGIKVTATPPARWRNLLRRQSHVEKLWRLYRSSDTWGIAFVLRMMKDHLL